MTEGRERRILGPWAAPHWHSLDFCNGQFENRKFFLGPADSLIEVMALRGYHIEDDLGCDYVQHRCAIVLHP